MNYIIKKMTDYSSLSYWENRYTNEHLEIFEWYQTYETLKEKIGEYLKPTDKVLNVGCGTSKFAEDLYIDDIKDVTNIDFSENAIKIMVEYYQEQQVEMNYKKMNVCQMPILPIRRLMLYLIRLYWIQCYVGRMLWLMLKK